MSCLVHEICSIGESLRPQIIVTAPTGSTVTCDGIQGVEVSGTWTFNTTIGTHTIVASKSGQSKTQTVNVDEIAQYSVSISYTTICTVTISGTGRTSQGLAYVKYNGTNYSRAGSFTYNSGTASTISCYAQGTSSGVNNSGVWLQRKGERTSTKVSNSSGTAYSYTPSATVSAIAIALSFGNNGVGKVTITES